VIVVPFVPLNVIEALTVNVTPGGEKIIPFPNMPSVALFVTPP
jgi:hypothetical protein